MATRQQIQSLAEEAICPICLDFFTDPVSLECGHNFCRSCITQCWEKERNSCPECRMKLTEGSLRASRVLASLAEKARKLKLNQKEKESKLHCKDHQEELKLFCETDKKLICVNCVVSQEHREHRFIPIKEAVEIYKDGVKSSLDFLTEKKSTVLQMEQKQKRRISQIRASSLQSHITSEFAEMHQILTEKEQRLIRDLREDEERILNIMQKNLRELQENLKSTEERLSELQKQLKQTDGVTFLKVEASQKRRISNDVNELSLANGEICIEKFNGPLQYSVWKELLDAIKPVSVTLDVETAHPWLEVSEDLKSLRLTRTRTRTQWSPPDTGKRFTDRPCVFGSEGFTSGRHYWEVAVNRYWSLGVAAESVDRERVGQVSPETGFWTIGRYKDQFNINNSLVCPLPVGQIPRKVGVYLSYESGIVSFYNADTKSHLHTFTGNKFAGKMYPFFETCDEKKWIRICSGSEPSQEKRRTLRLVTSSLMSQ
ncbi:zinc-binding protein A33-like isoform X2 [Scyliorhinus canicula]|uniref:zinc-binding protein A33-like isoform X2 n=1 Tax=Scyliorhinus canicula TaxID=7830 RepID=UPI0018F688CB|nr:zinc-binding protein A33-like isoform X2 [Scyliorhinus canicula]